MHIPTDLLAQVAPKRAEWCAVNFAYNSIFDNAAARRDLGFRYTVRWIEGVQRVVDWLDAHGGLEDSRDFSWYDGIIESWRRLGTRMTDELAGLDL